MNNLKEILNNPNDKLNELLVFVNGLEKDVIENALQRHQLYKLIHAKLLFKDDK